MGQWVGVSYCDICWYPHVFCYARKKLVAGFRFYFWKVIVFNPQSFSLSIQLQYCLPSFAFRHSVNALTAAGKLQLAAVPCLMPGGELFSPHPAQLGAPCLCKAKHCLYFSPSLCISLQLIFSHFGKCNKLWFNFLASWAFKLNFNLFFLKCFMHVNL